MTNEERCRNEGLDGREGRDAHYKDEGVLAEGE
jgi:hypothetical protein